MEQKYEDYLRSQPEQCEELKRYKLEHPECDDLCILPPSTTIYNGEAFWDFFSEGKRTAYKVSLSGKVLGARGHIMNPKPHGGYIRIDFLINKVRSFFYVHVMIADTFLFNGNPLIYTQKDHKKGDKIDNRVCALRHVTQSQNILNRPPSKNFKSVVEIGIDIDGNKNIIGEWSSVVEASEITTITKGRIRNSCEDPELKPDGRIFYYKNDFLNINNETPESKKLKVLEDKYKSFRPDRINSPVIIIDSNPNIKPRIWRSAQDAAEALGFKSNSSICRQMNGHLNTAHGYKWKYATKEEIKSHLVRVPPESLEDGKWVELEIENRVILVSDMGFIITGKGFSIGSPDGGGYLHIKINRRCIGVNRLVLMAFDPIENPELYEADHIVPGNVQDNRRVNLRWLLQQQNCVAAHGMPIIQYCLYGGFIRRFESIQQIINTYNVAHKTIRPIIGSFKTFNDHFFAFEKDGNIFSRNDLPVIQYDLQNPVLATFTDIFEISEFFDFTYSQILTAIDSKQLLGDHLYRFQT